MDSLPLNILIGILAALAGGLVWKTACADNVSRIIGKAEEKKKDVKNEIKKIPAADIVNAAPDADALRAEAAGITGRAKQRLRDKVRELISRQHRTGNTNSGGE